MKALAVIAEYNPFHNGHKFQLDMAKKLTGHDCAVVIMSGSFVQRGEPAVYDKWARARAAVLCGADLVLELNTNYALASAEFFALGAVKTLGALGISGHLCFGSESGDIAALKRAAKLLTDEKAALNPLISNALKKGLSYPAAREAAVKKLDPTAAAVLKFPNEILGIEYIKAIYETGAPLEPCAILRAAVGHDSPKTDGGFASASAIRRLIGANKRIEKFVPPAAAKVFAKCRPVSLGDFEELILYSLRAADLSSFRAAGDGLAARLRLAMGEPSVLGALSAAKTKRHTMSRIKRLLMNILLDNTLAPDIPPSFIRVLGLNDKGAALLKKAKGKCPLPIITKPARAPRGDSLWELDQRAADIYTIPRRMPAGEDYKSTPFVLR